MARMYVFRSFQGPIECIDPPNYSDFGYDNITWDGSKVHNKKNANQGTTWGKRDFLAL